MHGTMSLKFMVTFWPTCRLMWLWRILCTVRRRERCRQTEGGESLAWPSPWYEYVKISGKQKGTQGYVETMLCELEVGSECNEVIGATVAVGEKNETRQAIDVWHWVAFVQPLQQWKSNNYYILWVRVCSLRYPACNAHAPYCRLWPVALYAIFFHIIS